MDATKGDRELDFGYFEPGGVFSMVKRSGNTCWPDATVTASSGGYSHSWYTNAEGYADVYLRGPSPGQTINLTVGAASCSTTAG
jgi:hypothetical protein